MEGVLDESKTKIEPKLESEEGKSNIENTKDNAISSKLVETEGELLLDDNKIIEDEADIQNDVKVGEEEKQSDDNDDSDEGDEDKFEMEPPEASQKPEDLEKEGLECLRNRRVDEAVHKLAWALELKLQELNYDELHECLGEYYLNYGNALLTQEEMSNELFTFEKGSTYMQSSSSSSSSAIPGPSSDHSVSCLGHEEPRLGVTDEQLAWENLETARVVFQKALDKRSEAAGSGLSNVDSKSVPKDASSPRTTKEIVEDLTFALLRLGDMCMLQDNFEEAVTILSSAVELREKHNFPYTSLEAPIIALAQAQLFASRPKEALTNFQIAHSYVEDHLNETGDLAIPSDTEQGLKQRRDYELTAEDLFLQMEEIRRNIKDGTYGNDESSQPVDTTSINEDPPSESSSSRYKRSAPSSPPNMSQFDKSILSSSQFPIRDLGIVSKRSKVVIESEEDQKSGETNCD